VPGKTGLKGEKLHHIVPGKSVLIRIHQAASEWGRYGNHQGQRLCFMDKKKQSQVILQMELLLKLKNATVYYYLNQGLK